MNETERAALRLTVPIDDRNGMRVGEVRPVAELAAMLR
jgi:hypothetical protein